MARDHLSRAEERKMHRFSQHLDRTFFLTLDAWTGGTHSVPEEFVHHVHQMSNVPTAKVLRPRARAVSLGVIPTDTVSITKSLCPKVLMWNLREELTL